MLSGVVQGDRRVEPWPEEAVDNSHGLYSLHQMFDIVGAQLTHRDVRVLSFLFVDVIDEYERGGIRSGRDFLLALERQGRCDETNFRHILQLLRIITRHDLLAYVTLRKRQAGEWAGLELPAPFGSTSLVKVLNPAARPGTGFTERRPGGWRTFQCSNVSPPPTTFSFFVK